MCRIRRISSKHPELVIVPLLVAIAVFVFDLGDYDLSLSGYFFDPASKNWPATADPAIDFLNHYFLEWFTVFAVLTAVGLVVVARVVGNGHEWRRVGVFLLLTMAIGPGLLINGLFKTQWGRPRPEQVIEFGGQQAFRRPFDPGKGGAPERGGAGRSFPSGHAAVAFWSSSAFFVARYLMPGGAPIVLLVSIALGTVVGVARVATGRHFVSDVLWAGIIVFTVNGLIAYAVLKLPRRPQPPVAPQ